MRLRHKKPLNPYKGQTNNDKNEFNDDDFKQQGSPHKKAANGSTDQIYKYARILTKFIKTINQQYNAYQLQSHHPLTQQHIQRPKSPTTLPSQNTTPTNSLRPQQIKQQKQITKIQSKKQPKEDIRDTRPSSKKKDAPPTLPPSKQNKSKALENSFSNSLDLSKNTISPKNASQALFKNEKEILRQKEENSNKNSINLPTHLSPNAHGFSIQNPKMMDNMPDSIPSNANIQNYMGMQGIFNPNQLMNLQMLRSMNQLPLGQIPFLEKMMQGYFPLQLMNNMNMPIMNMGMSINNPQLLLPTHKIPYQNLFSEQVKVYNNKITPPESKNIKEVYPLKRSAFHVAIAYKIYLDKLKKQGHSFQKLEDIDPTKQARRIKAGQNQNSKGKQSIKKKK